MKTVVAFFLAVGAIAALSAFCTMHWMGKSHSAPSDPHEWLHAQLDLTEKQHEALKPIEARFNASYGEAGVKLWEARTELAKALDAGDADSPEIAAAVHKIHQRMGKLQMLSIRHIFEMRTVLTKEQGDKLLHLAKQNLEEAP